MITETIGLADTFTIIRDTVITITDITPKQSLSVGVTTQTLAFTSLPTGPGSRSDWAFEVVQGAWNFFQAILTITNKENANSSQTSSFLDSPPTPCRWGFLLSRVPPAKANSKRSSSGGWAVRPTL